MSMWSLYSYAIAMSAPSALTGLNRQWCGTLIN